jgi:VTC domain-containing protein
MNELTACFEPISLGELNVCAELLSRFDHKYIVDLDTLDELVDAMRKHFLVLEIDERRVFDYETVYFDSPGLANYRAHLQGRRRRFKMRSRRYVDTGTHFFELKLKGRRGHTDKRRIPIDPDDHATLTGEAERFAEGVLEEAYGHGLPDGMRPTLEMAYKRITFAAKDGGERVTWDFDLSFGDAALSGAHAIVETKTPAGKGRADRALRDFGVRPVSCSKYCAGIGLTRPDVRSNPWARLLRRYFVPAGVTAAIGATP